MRVNLNQRYDLSPSTAVRRHTMRHEWMVQAPITRRLPEDIMRPTWEFPSNSYYARRKMGSRTRFRNGLYLGQCCSVSESFTRQLPSQRSSTPHPNRPFNRHEHNITNAIAARTLHTAMARLSRTRTSMNREHLFQILVSTPFSDPAQCMNQIFHDTRPAHTIVKYNCLLRTRGDDPGINPACAGQVFIVRI